MQHTHGNIPYMFGCWADPVVHLLPKSSMAWLTKRDRQREKERERE